MTGPQGNQLRLALLLRDNNLWHDDVAGDDRRDGDAIAGQMAHNLVNMCKDEAGRYIGNTFGINMYDTLNALWRRFVCSNLT